MWNHLYIFWVFLLFETCFGQTPSNPLCKGQIGDYKYDITQLQNDQTDYVIDGVNAGGKNPWRITMNMCRSLVTAVTPACPDGTSGCQRWDMPAPTFKAILGLESTMGVTPLHLKGEDPRFEGQYGLVVNYTGGSVTMMIVNLVCNESVTGTGNPTAYSVTGGKFIFDWQTPIACNLNHPKGKKLSGGSVILIIVLCFGIVYLAGGLVVNKLVRHQEGLEIIPNYVFWISIPGLVKDGVMLIVNKIRGKGGYSQV